MRVLDHDYCSIHHGTDGNGNAPQRHDVGVNALVMHDDERRQNPQGQRHNGHKGRAQVKEEDGAHHGHYQKFFQQLVAQVGDGALNQAGAVVHRHNFNALGQATLQLRQLCFHGGNGVQSVFA